MTPLTMAILAAAPLAMAPLAVVPFTMVSLAVVPLAVVSLTTSRSNDREVNRPQRRQLVATCMISLYLTVAQPQSWSCAYDRLKTLGFLVCWNWACFNLNLAHFV